MKLSELPLRDYIALEVLPAIVARGEKNSTVQVNAAYDVADTMLHKMDRASDEIKNLHKALANAETANSILLNMNEDGNFSVRVALMQIWEMLNVKDQTAAMLKLAVWKDALINDRA